MDDVKLDENHFISFPMSHRIKGAIPTRPSFVSGHKTFCCPQLIDRFKGHTRIMRKVFKEVDEENILSGLNYISVEFLYYI